MFNRPLTVDDLARLKRERDEADRAYNDALTALDGAVQRRRDMPHPPSSYDEHQITPLNEHRDLLQARPGRPPGWRGWVHSLIWDAVAPLFERQQAFNSAIVDHTNRNVAMYREFTPALTSTIGLLREELDQLIHFENHLIQYAQQITAYVDTKDRDVIRLIFEVSSSIGAVSDELSKRWESMVARERRFEQRAAEREQAAVEQAEDLRTSFGVVHQVTQTLKRELGRLQAAGLPASTPNVDVSVPHPRPSTGDVVHQALDSYKYVLFENEYRGSTDDIRERLAAYLPHFDGATDVLDVGCGRGEFLDLLRERGVTARGIDTNHEMVQVCGERGLAADEGDALTYLGELPDASLGGLFSAQVVEHLEPGYLLQLLDTAFLKLRPGATLVLETINTASWAAFFSSYIRDITHIRPLHPDTLQYFVTASGFQHVRVEYRSPWPASSKLESLSVPDHDGSSETLSALVARVHTFNRNVERLNGLLFADQDFAVIGDRR